jgi:hypothetical protein
VKKTLFVTLGLLMILLMMSCASGGGKGNASTANSPSSANQGRRVNSRVPEFVRNYMRNTPEDALVGIGTANMGNLNRSMQAARQRARAEISRQMIVIVQDMVADFTAGSEDDRSAGTSFMENVSSSLSRSTLRGSSSVDEDEDERGNYWVVMMLNRTSAVQEINQAVSAAKLAVPRMQAFDAQARMNAAFDAHYKKEIGYADKD